MTTILAKDIVANGDTARVPVESGQYMIGVSGDFGAGGVQIKVDLGPATGVPVSGAAYTAAKAEVIWLPACTVYATVSGATNPKITIALAELSTKLEA